MTWCYTQVKDNLYVSRAMTGVRAAVAPVVASAALKLRKAALTDRQQGMFFLLLAFALYLFGGRELHPHRTHQRIFRLAAVRLALPGREAAHDPP